MNLNRTQLAIFSGYGQIASAIGASLLMVPLALRHLNEAEFGLWVVIGQSLGFLLLLDFGLGNSAGRILAEPIHQNDTNELVSWWTVLVGALASQGVIILLIGYLLTDLILGFLEIPESLLNDARFLWMGMVTFNAIARPLNALNGIYYVQNRIYIVNIASMAMSWASMALFWLFLSLGFRTSAYMYATIAAWTIQASILLFGLTIRKQLPAFRFKSFDWSKLKALYSYSFWTFLMAISIQAILMSQSLIISKVLGITAVAAFSVSVRASNMLSQVLWRTFDAFSPVWLKAHLKGELENFHRGWESGLVWSISSAMILTAGFLATNRVFVSIYAREDLWAGRTLDIALAAWVILHSFIHAASLPFLITRNVRPLSLVSLAETPISLLSGMLFCYYFGLPGLYLGAIISSVFFTAGYLWRRTPTEAAMQYGLSRVLNDSRVWKSAVVFASSLASLHFLRDSFWFGIRVGEWIAMLITFIAILWMIHSLLSLRKKNHRFGPQF